VFPCFAGPPISAIPYGGVSKKSFPSEVRFPLFRPYLVAPPNRSPRQRLYTPSPVKELPKGTGSLRRLPPLGLGGKAPKQLTRVRVVGYTAWQKFLGMERTFWTHLRTLSMRPKPCLQKGPWTLSEPLSCHPANVSQKTPTFFVLGACTLGSSDMDPFGPSSR
jgi:hypothetical protein